MGRGVKNQANKSFFIAGINSLLGNELIFIFGVI